MKLFLSAAKNGWLTSFKACLLFACSALLLAACGAGSAAGTQAPNPVAAQAGNLSAMLGANLPAISDYSFTPVYVDLVHQARRFGPPDSPWGGSASAVETGSDGWPVGDFGIFLMSRPGLAGIYKISFDGLASVAAPASKDTVLRNQNYNAARNRTTLELVRGAQAGQMVLALTQTRTSANASPGSGIKNLQVIRPGYGDENPPLFTAEFLDHIARFKTLRFMDWLRTNNNLVGSWAERSTLNTHYAADAGVPWEHIVALANQTQKDIWINLPVYADDDYIRQLAGMLKSTLNANRRIYVEYSNELWNWGFWQYGHNSELAKAEVAADPKSPLVYDGSTNTDLWMYRRIAKRGKEISDIFRSVYGDAAMMSTVRPIFASQAVSPYVSQLGLDFIATVYGNASRYFYAMAVAPYFNMGSQQKVDGLTVDQVLQALDNSIDNLPKANYFEANLALARWHGLPLLAYEGGSDTFGPGSVAAKKAASLDPRMLALCTRYLTTWYQHGGGLFMWFSAGAGNWDTPYGTWELTTDLALTGTPKIQCMDATLQASPPTVSYRNVAPGSFDARSYVGNADFDTAQIDTRIRYLHPDSPPVDYLVLAPAGGTYELVLSAAAMSTGNSIDVLVNSKTVATAFELKVSGSFDVPVDNSPINVSLTPGFNTLRIKTRAENSNPAVSAGFAPFTLTIR